MNAPIQPAVSQYDIRSEFRKTLFRHLVGPAKGETEVVEGDPRHRYLFGVLGPANAQFDEMDQEEVGAGMEPETGEEGKEEATSGRPTLIPNSFGMTFCADASSAQLRIDASWGHYKVQGGEGSSKKKWTEYIRTPMTGWVKLDLEAHAQGGSKRLELHSPKHGILEGVVVTAVVRKRNHGWIVTLFLVNEQLEAVRSKVDRQLFQARLEVAEVNSRPVFLKHPRQEERPGLDPADREELADLDMLYRKEVEFAVGHGVSVHANLDPVDRAISLVTSTMPGYEVPRTDAAGVGDVCLDMKALGECEDLREALAPLPEAYGAWILQRQADLDAGKDGLEDWKERGAAALRHCEDAKRRIQEGIDLLARDGEAARCFRFANRAMYLQRIHTIYSEQRRRELDRGEKKGLRLVDVDVPENHRWRPFQLAFVLLNLPGLTALDHPERRTDKEAMADLLFFPTGGGKTEAYLGLAAYTLAIRRRQGKVGDRDGENGVAVLMRYTLRLLTLQQYQRAAALICAAETIRRESWERGDKLWGETPFRIGLWVGANSTPNTTEAADEALKQIRRNKYASGASSVVQFRNCPWCGSKIEAGVDMRVDSTGRYRTFTFCGEKLGRCPFTERQAPTEGLPVLCVDEEIYRLLPSMVIATVDKFAQMPFNGQIQMLFGRVTGLCERHGYRSPETRDADSHPKTKQLPAAKTIACAPLRPPDLIIQDELHLISGPLGTLVGLYETAVEQLATFVVNGQEVRPKLVLSTATIRRADLQVKQLFNHQVAVFPPHGLSVDDNFFSIRKRPSEETPGRLYLGLCAPGRKIKNVMIRVYSTILSAAQGLYETYGDAADPYMTLVGYFNSRRELGGVRRMVDDAIMAQARSMTGPGLGKRYIDPGRSVGELTSRLKATDIPEILDNLELKFSKDSEAARRKMAMGEMAVRRTRPYDVLLATNMIQVGVDVPRLGLMVAARQPKSTAEYIQATSRVGRRAPGLVITVFNWAHPRDLNHYERFNAYHAGFYKHVEANSVTPFSPRARDRALCAVLVSLIRQMDAEFNANEAAGHLSKDHPHVKRAMEAILRRAAATGNADLCHEVERELTLLIDLWMRRAMAKPGMAKLAYRKTGDGAGETRALLLQAGRDAPKGPDEARFIAQGSMRSVEPPVDLVHEGCLNLEADPPIRVMPVQEGK